MAVDVNPGQSSLPAARFFEDDTHREEVCERACTRVTSAESSERVSVEFDKITHFPLLLTLQVLNQRERSSRSLKQTGRGN